MPRGRLAAPARSMCGPPGNGSPSIRAPLSNASPAASSSVAPSTSNEPWSSTRARNVWPPLATRHTNGGSNGSGRRKFAATWPCRWSTGTSGTPRAAASALAVATPTSSAPTSPGPCVTATRSTSSSVAPASASAASTTGVDQLEVVARGDLGDDAAEAIVDALRGDHVRADLAVARDDRGAGVVAARLEREDQRSRRSRRAHGTGVRHVVERALERRRRAPHDRARPRRCPGSSARRVPAARKPKRSYSAIAPPFERRTSSVKRASSSRRCSRSSREQRAWRCPRAARSGRRRRSSRARPCRSASRSGSRRARRRGATRRGRCRLACESSSTNIASDHGVGKARRSIAMTCGRSA